MLIDGKAIAAELRNTLAKEAKQLFERVGRSAGLAVILVGNDYASSIYVRNKIKACQEVGIESTFIEYSDNVSEKELLDKINELNKNDKIDGILVQLPLPKHISVKNVVDAISATKDVDGFGVDSIGKLCLGDVGLRSCTPEGCIKLLKSTKVALEGKHAVVVGRSNEVGKPMALLLLAENCTVTVCHSRTANLAEMTKQADILVAAVGKPRLIKGDMVKDGVIVIDVGINRENGKTVGDVDFESVKDKASYITPVPGGVGPMTIATLMSNTMKAYKLHNGL